MNVTNMMRADEIANGFNSVIERQYWRASIAGSRSHPEVHFNSRASMVQISYRIVQADFTVSFTKANAVFGDYMASTFRSMEQVLSSLKAAALPFAACMDQNAVLRLEYAPVGGRVTVHIAHMGDDWPEKSVEPLSFKVPARNNSGI